MAESKDISEELTKKIEDIRKDVITGDITLLDLELVPLFNELKDTLTVHNLNNYSLTYKDACGLLNQKFDELKQLLSTSNTEKKFIEFLETKPDDEIIAELFTGCWSRNFVMNSLSFQFLERCKDRLCQDKPEPFIYEPVVEEKVKDEFILEVPKFKFTEKMNNYFKSIENMLPCSFNDIFEKEQDDVKLCMNFVYLLHLLQSGKLQYQKETNFLYVS